MSARKWHGARSLHLVAAATTDVRPPPALTHGLTSHRMRVAMREDVEALIPALIGAAYSEPPVVDAARAAAEAILHLHYVRQARRSAIEKLRPEPEELRSIGGRSTGDADRESGRVTSAMRGTSSVDGTEPGDPELTLALIIAQAPKALRNMADYERRAISGRAKALRRLALEKIEAERRHHR